jgi:hypothetical protein
MENMRLEIQTAAKGTWYDKFRKVKRSS